MNLGLTCWLATTGGWPVLLDAAGVDGKTIGYQLGYAKVDEHWQLAVRKVAAVQRFFEGDEDMPYVDVNELSPPTPLVRASRNARIEACAHLSELAYQLTSEVERRLDGLEKAKGRDRRGGAS